MIDLTKSDIVIKKKLRADDFCIEVRFKIDDNHVDFKMSMEQSEAIAATWLNISPAKLSALRTLLCSEEEIERCKSLTERLESKKKRWATVKE